MAIQYITGSGASNFDTGPIQRNPSNRVLQNKAYSISQPYGGSHNGVDLTGPGNTTDYIVAHSNGVVVACEGSLSYNAPGASGTASYGDYVKLQHPNGMYTLYAHLAYIKVYNGQTVQQGQVLGYMGNTGNSYGAHLHFEVRNSGDSRIDPAPFLVSDLTGYNSAADAGNYGDGSGTAGGEGKPAAPATVEITDVVVKSVEGKSGSRAPDQLGKVKELDHGCEILVQNGNKIMMPLLTDSVTVEWSRAGSPGSLKFSCLIDDKLDITEGNPVSMRWEGKNIFYGYIFEMKRSDPYKISVTVYDQLRYLKNKGTLSYGNKKYSELLKMLAEDYQLSLGTVEDTGYVISQRIEDGTLFDILGNAADETLINKGKIYVLYDDFGKIQLKDIESMTLPLLIDEDTGSSYDYSTGIDKDVYSKIVLASDNNQTGERELYVANSSKLQQSWGILQYYESISSSNAETLKETAKAYLKYYGQKRRSLSIKKCLGDIRVRGGSSLVVKLAFDDIKVQNYMLVEKVKHTFEQGVHTMDIDVAGIKGEFVV